MKRDSRIEAYLSQAFGMLREGKTPDEVKRALMTSGLPEEGAAFVVSQSQTNLANYRKYKQETLLGGTTSEIWIGIAILVVGYGVSFLTEDSAGRLRSLHIIVYLVGIAFIGHAIYWKMKAREK